MIDGGVFGGDGDDDLVKGGPGADDLFGNDGVGDVCEGGPGADTFPDGSCEDEKQGPA